MKRRDPILDELHKVREAIAKAHDYDVYKIAASIRGREEKATAGKRRPQASKRLSRQRKAS